MDRRDFARLAAGASVFSLFATAASSVPAFAYPWPPALRRGMRGKEVLELQVRIAGWASDTPNGANFALDGSFGPGTEAAVRRFQRGYGLAVDGVAGPATQRVLNSLESPNGTRNFAWSEFDCRGHSDFAGGKVGAGEVRESVRRTMYKLEAVRKRIGNRPININSGFRCVARNNQTPGASRTSRHMYGRAVDLQIPAGVSGNQLLTEIRKAGFTYSYDKGYVHGQVT